MKNISPIQQQILDFIISSTESHGYPPSVREIGEEVGLRSSSSVHAHVSHLRALGYLQQQEEGKKRALVVNQPTRMPMGMVPILGQVTAGMPILAVEQNEGYLPYDKAQGNDDYFALRIKGDSMIGVGIMHGDYIIVKAHASPAHRQIVVAMIDDEATCKTLHLDGGDVWLLPENPAYSPIHAPNCNILGVVTAVHRIYEH